jgi:hypothetical protein
MSVLVTGVPTRKRAKRKLKMRDVEPRGATYSEERRQRGACMDGRRGGRPPARKYSRASVLPIS